ncbi:hypothetical protein MMC18_001374 [Xylographa bjoerkii]|nr:hypothetical protein [Xylographa bjoerkii]
MEVPNKKVTIVQHNKGEEIRVDPIVLHVLEDGSNTDNRIGAMHDETFLVTSGTVRFTTGTTDHDAKTGDDVVVPPMASHTFSNASDEVATMYNSFTPAFCVNYFRLLQEMAKKNGGKLDQKDGVEAMGRHPTLVAGKPGPPGAMDLREKN